MNYYELISINNIFQAWNEFRKGKRKRRDVQFFERNLEDNLFELHEELKAKTYRHGTYQSFYVYDPKQRHIHKAGVQDRIVHHLLYEYLYQLFDKTFVFDSYSCRLEKGTHKAVDRLEKFTRAVSKNYTRPCWALKLDIRKFFASINHKILFQLLEKKIQDKDVLWLLSEIIASFHSEYGKNKGIPLGNLTSQIFANIYLGELDKFAKHRMKLKFYLRYCDDFVLLSNEKDYLYCCTAMLKQFLREKLKLELHPKKIILRKVSMGIDFLGYIILPHYRLPRIKTRKRMFRKIMVPTASSQSLESYLGYLLHANSYKISQELKNIFWLSR